MVFHNGGENDYEGCLGRIALLLLNLKAIVYEYKKKLDVCLKDECPVTFCRGKRVIKGRLHPKLIPVRHVKKCPAEMTEVHCALSNGNSEWMIMRICFSM